MTIGRERGHALLAALIISLLLGTACASLVILSVANATASQKGVRRAVALTLAEVGVERAKAAISDGIFDAQFADYNHQATAADEVFAPDALTYGEYAVRVVENHGGVDGQYLVISQGVTGQTTRQISVVLRRTPVELPNFLAAITLYNPNALASFSGQPPNVCGLDTDLPDGIDLADLKASDCTPGSGDGPDAVGVGVHDDQSVVDIIDALGNKTDRIIGTDGSGGGEGASVYNMAVENPTGQTDPMTAADIVELADRYVALADYTYDDHNWYNDQGSPAPNGNFGTTADPKIVVIRSGDGGCLHLNGCLAGAGILIIDCDVQFGGTFNYAGLVLITQRGEATVSVDMRGTPLVMGAMVAANPADDATSILDLRGTTDVFFSRGALSYAEDALSGSAKFEKVFYMENKPDAADLEMD